MTSKAAAGRFLRAHAGRMFNTEQVTPRGTWRPGPRKLTLRGTSFRFGDSHFALETGMTVTELTDTSVTLTYPPEWGMTVTYSLAD